MTEQNPHGFLGQRVENLREMWLEIPGDCHLNCTYCFAFENPQDFTFQRVGKQIIRTDKKPDLLSIDEILENIRQFAEDFPLTQEEREAGVRKELAIPGSGEPFVNPRMKNYVYAVLDACLAHDIIATIFTTGDRITEEDMDLLETYQQNLRLFIKFNSTDPRVQDALVKRSGYTAARQPVMDRLIERGFDDGRLGIVTSIMHNNTAEMESMLRYARDRNLKFDADIIIDRGRGAECKCKLGREDRNELMETIRKLQKIDREEYGNIWTPSSTYVGSDPCTRFDHHLYIKRTGEVSPCVGSPQIILGNTRTQSLKEIWESPLTKVIRRHELEGACTECENYKQEKCFSCLVRSIDPEKFTTEYLERTGRIPTMGCGICGPEK